MKKSKKFVSLFLALLFIVIVNITAYAAEPRYVPDAIEIIIYAQASGNVASSLVTGNYGHAFVEISNHSGAPIRIGARTIPNNSCMTLGRWKTGEHRGIYYNLEAVRHDVDGDYYYKACTLSESARANISNWLLNPANNYWDVTANCSHMAITLWNYAASSSDDFSCSTYQTPTNLELQMRTAGCNTTGRPSSASTAYYASGSTTVVSSHTANSW